METQIKTYLEETLGLDVEVLDGISQDGFTHIGTEAKVIGQYVGYQATGVYNGKEVLVSVTMEIVINKTPKVENAYYLVNGVEYPLGKNTYKVTDLHWLL